MADFISSFKDREICIPLIQRDYVQSYSESVINSIVDQFTDALEGRDTVNLNYIYGIGEKGESFTPIDGQQRLTTLWLYHLYIAKRIGKNFGTKLIYQSRDYANQFCESLLTEAVPFEDNLTGQSIANLSWFIPEWSKDPSVDAMLEALDVIGLKLKDKDADELERMWDRLIGDSSPIRFSFYSTDNLGDDIYIKMNGRGFSLTSFENFKSWIDEQLSGKAKLSSFYDTWKERIDNEWTDLFWKNRGSSYEIDELQLRAFYNLVYIFWHSKASGEKQKPVTETLEKTIKSDSYNFEPYELDKNGLFCDEFFEWVCEVFDALCAVNDDFNNLDRSLTFRGKNAPLLNRIMMASDSQEEKKRLLTFALCRYAMSMERMRNNASLFDWMYRWRNLVLNDALNGSFEEQLDTIDYVAELLSKETHINDVFSDLDVNSGAIDNSVSREKGVGKRFNEKFLRFEQYKSVILKSGNQYMTNALHRLENNPLLVGSGVILSSLIPAENALKEPERFIRYCELLNHLYDEESRLYNQDNLRRALIYFGDETKGFGGRESGLWSFLNGDEDWKWFINESSGDSTEVEINRKALNGLLDYLMLSDNLESAIETIINPEAESAPGYEPLREDDWRHMFVYHPEILEYTNQKCCNLEDSQNIILSRSTRLSNNCNRMNVRTLLLYYDIEGRFEGRGWSLGMYQRENSCITLEKESENSKLIITAEYVHEDKAYSIRIRRENLADESSDTFPELRDFGYTKEMDDDGIRKSGFSKEDTINELERLCKLLH